MPRSPLNHPKLLGFVVAAVEAFTTIINIFRRRRPNAGLAIVPRRRRSFLQEKNADVICQNPYDEHFCVGGFADIHRGLLNGRLVAIKVFRHPVRLSAYEDLHREVEIMHRLDHPRILPFWRTLIWNGMPSLITPWMDHGTLGEFVEQRPDFSKPALLVGIVDGLVYLKSKWVVHGDLKGKNILVDESGMPKIADFGLSRFHDPGGEQSIFHRAMKSTSLFKFRTKNSTHSHRVLIGAGTRRWMAPELHQPELVGKTAPMSTFESDIFAFGMVIYEVYSSKIPFEGVGEFHAIANIVDGRRPKQPTLAPDHIWSIAEGCWQQYPSHRLGIKTIEARLRSQL